jgi:hypothetical protein
VTTEFPPIPVGTTFTVPIGGALVLGAVHATAPGRVYAQTMDPPLTRDWQIAGDSWWVVDDLGFHDGSWPMRPQPPNFQAEPLRRFAGQLDGKRVLIARDPVTLIAGFDNVKIVSTADEEREWEEAPNLLPTDPRSFEIALANTLRLPPPDHHVDEKERDRRQVLALVRQHVTDVTQPRPFDHVIFFRSGRAARAAADALRASGLQAKLDAPFFGTKTLEVTELAVPRYPDLAPRIAHWQAFARQHEGEYDGFGSAIDRAPA